MVLSLAVKAPARPYLVLMGGSGAGNRALKDGPGERYDGTIDGAPQNETMGKWWNRMISPAKKMDFMGFNGIGSWFMIAKSVQVQWGL